MFFGMTTGGRFHMEAIAHAFSGRGGQRLPCDPYTSELLAKVAESPVILKTWAVTHLIERLKELLEESYSPTEVAIVSLALVKVNLEAIQDGLGRLSTSTDDLMNIALTLQRFPETRTQGTSIFEHLLLANAYKAEATTKVVDRRF